MEQGGGWAAALWKVPGGLSILFLPPLSTPSSTEHGDLQVGAMGWPPFTGVDKKPHS